MRAPALSEIVLFELPTIWSAERLLKHIGSERFAWLQAAEGIVLVGVMLTADELDLAALLRSVQTWLPGVRLPAVRIEVDGRTYFLEAKPKAAVQPIG